MGEEYVTEKSGTRYKVVFRETCDHPDSGNVKNAWRWNWLQERDHGNHGHFLSDYLVKVDVDGIAFCRWCKIPVIYRSGRKEKCRLHAKRHADHEKYILAMKDSMVLPAAYGGEVGVEGLPYGAASNVTSVVGSNAVAARTGPGVKHSVNITDRVHHLEAMTLSFICENTLSLTIAPKLVHFAKACASDPRTLKKLPVMNRTTATYKIKHGLAENQ